MHFFARAGVLDDVAVQGWAMPYSSSLDIERVSAALTGLGRGKVLAIEDGEGCLRLSGIIEFGNARSRSGV